MEKNYTEKKESNTRKILLNIFVIITPLITLALFVGAGFYLGYVPKVTGSVGGYFMTTGSTDTEYIFRLKRAIGIWLIGLAISLLVFLICVLIRKIYLCSKSKIEE